MVALEVKRRRNGERREKTAASVIASDDVYIAEQ